MPFSYNKNELYFLSKRCKNILYSQCLQYQFLVKMNAYFFDMDGVIFDSMPNHAAAWEEVMNNYNLPFGVKDCYVNEGRTGMDVIIESYKKVYGAIPPQNLVKEIYDKKTESFSRRGPAMPMKGIKKVLEFLHQEEEQIWIVTGSGQMSLFDTLNIHFPNIFTRQRMITAFDVTRGKPHPEPYLRAWELSKLAKENCTVIENAPLGVRAAKQADLFTIAVNTGPLDKKLLYQENADIVLNNMDELLCFLKVKQHIDKEIVPLYRTFDDAHNVSHMKRVIEQSLLLARPISDVNPLLCFTIAAYHDVGLVKDRKTHHIHSAEYIRNDKFLTELFSPEEIILMAEAAEDHRASNASQPRSIYGAIVAEADRDLRPTVVMRRTLQFGLKHYPEQSKVEHIRRAISHIEEKYGEQGYLHLPIGSADNIAGLQEIHRLIGNKPLLSAELAKIYDNLIG